VTHYLEFPTRLEANQSVRVRARVQGVLEEKNFESGAMVEKGTLLFRIEPEPYEAALARAEANLASARAALEIAEADLQRKEQAFKSNAVSEIDVLTARARQSEAEAAVKASETAVTDARINLGYTEIHSPISGQVSDSQADPGNLVGTQDAVLLTTVVDSSSLTGSIQISEREYLAYLRRVAEGQQRPPEEVDFKLKLVDGTIYSETGSLVFIDNQVDRDTGTIRVQIRFPNPRGELAAGFFARIMIPIVFNDAEVVPAAAVQRDIGGDFVAVVGQDNVVERRAVFKGPQIGSQQVIEEGLSAEDRVVIAGLQRAIPGAKVTPVPPDPGLAGESGGEQPAPESEQSPPEGGAQTETE
jgi:membrane fusion protein (multidrug efflux system)